MNFVPTKEHTEVSLQEGLNALEVGDTNKLFSDGLESDEYIYFDKENGFCYEDKCVIGHTVEKALAVLHAIGWCFTHKFFVKNFKSHQPQTGGSNYLSENK